MGDAKVIAILQAESISSLVLPQGAGRRALANLGTTGAALIAIARDESCANNVRFAAFESWIVSEGQGEIARLDDATADAMAHVYARAIVETNDAGLWSLPAEVLRSSVSRHAIALQRRALPHLLPLLDDTRELPYTGSEISAIASLHRYRVADLAAALISVIVGQPYRDDIDPANRDPQIAALKKAVMLPLDARG